MLIFLYVILQEQRIPTSAKLPAKNFRKAIRTGPLSRHQPVYRSPSILLLFHLRLPISTSRPMRPHLHPSASAARSSGTTYQTRVTSPSWTTHARALTSLHIPLFRLLLRRRIPQTALGLSMRPPLLLPTPLQPGLALLILLVSSLLQHLPYRSIPTNGGTVLPLGERSEFLPACKFRRVFSHRCSILIHLRLDRTCFL
jgi:hypothetical protein